MIERVSFHEFKSLHQVSIDLGRFVVIVGPNGSGKTSILDGLLYLARATTSPLDNVMSGVYEPANLERRGASSPMAIEMAGHFEGNAAEVRIAPMSQDDKPEFGVHRRWGKYVSTNDQHGVEKTRTAPPKSSKYRLPPPRKGKAPYYGREDAAMKKLAESVGAVRKLRLDVERLAAPSYSDEETPTMHTNGEGLAMVLADLAGRSPETFQNIQDAVRAVVPTLERIRTQRARVLKRESQEIRIDDKPILHEVERSIWGQQILLDFKGAPNIPAPLSSEGTLLVIGLLTALWSNPRPRLLLLDDIDKALHPRAQAELVAQLRKVLALDANLQIIATSHSPYLLDHFEPQEVLVTALDDDGSTVCASLTEHPDFARWKDNTRTGELWSFVGEDWINAPKNRRVRHEK